MDSHVQRLATTMRAEAVAAVNARQHQRLGELSDFDSSERSRLQYVST